MNSRMLLLQSYCPSEFNRRPQEVTNYHHFKATEFRQFLLYTAPAVLRNVFLEDHYRHLMILHSVMRLLVSEDTSRDMYAVCQRDLDAYVTVGEQLHGEQFLSYNVYSLLHIVADVEVLGPLETFSTFWYENNMPESRKCIRKLHLKLAQIYKRISEKDNFVSTPMQKNIKIFLSEKHVEGPLPEHIPANLCQQFKKVKIGQFTFATALRDSCCFLKNSRMCVIKNIIETGGQVQLIVKQFTSTTAIYDV